MKQVRLVAADLAEEILDLAEQYAKQFLDKDEGVGVGRSCRPPHPYSPPSSEKETENPANPLERQCAEPAVESKPPWDAQPDTAPQLRTASANAANRKKQEFKVLAILWDASEHDLSALTAQEISAHGEKLGLSIRHENVRKVIRMRLKKYVVTSRETKGNSTVFHFRLSAAGKEFFVSQYLAG
jgi:hypothetical protein